MNGGISRATSVGSDPVSEFYTRHPYPPPVENLDRARDEWRDPLRHRADFHLFWPREPYRAALDILVAGCGTWQAAKYAACRPGAQVVGIDVSTTSLTHTERLKQQYNLSNLLLRQLPVEQVERLQRRFDLIVCTGVLHHLADPDAGLAALRSVLKPHGAILLMVYAPYGRAGIYMLQDYCRRLRIGATERDLRELIASLEALPAQHPLAAVLRGSRDARDPHALADALLNPRDRAYSVPQLLELLERNDCRLGRWQHQAPYLPQCGAIAGTPHAARLEALPERERFAALELWRGTMTCHTAIVYRSDAPAAGRVRFDGDAWRGYVPVRLPWTILVEEHLPPGAAGVLLNRSHAFNDLVLRLDSRERRLFSAIDGRRTLVQVAADAGEPDERRARAFFETLWRYDQVVFDASAEA